MFGKPNKYRCKICKGVFMLKAENHYTAEKSERSGFALLANGAGTTYFDAFDCPFCGCQNIVGIRELQSYNSTDTITKEDDDEY